MSPFGRASELKAESLADRVNPSLDGRRPGDAVNRLDASVRQDDWSDDPTGGCGTAEGY